jgi:hypothetical protein
MKETTPPWIKVSDEMPKPWEKVKLGYQRTGAGGCVPTNWNSDGWITNSGHWSIRKVKHVHLDSIPTHWRHITEAESEAYRRRFL